MSDVADGAGGAPTKLTPELQARLIQYLRQGNYIVTACNAVGIDRTSFWRWMQIGEQETEGIHFEFCNAAKQAMAEGEAEMALRVRSATRDRVVEAAPEGFVLIPSSWQAAMTFLERRYPQRWGRRVQETKHSGSVEVTGAREELARKLGAGAAAGAADSDPVEPE